MKKTIIIFILQTLMLSWFVIYFYNKIDSIKRDDVFYYYNYNKLQLNKNTYNISLLQQEVYKEDINKARKLLEDNYSIDYNYNFDWFDKDWKIIFQCFGEIECNGFKYQRFKININSNTILIDN